MNTHYWQDCSKLLSLPTWLIHYSAPRKPLACGILNAKCTYITEITGVVSIKNTGCIDFNSGASIAQTASSPLQEKLQGKCAALVSACLAATTYRCVRAAKLVPVVCKAWIIHTSTSCLPSRPRRFLQRHAVPLEFKTAKKATPKHQHKKKPAGIRQRVLRT